MRVDTWQTDMNEAIISGRDKGFVWGENDCCLFSCSVVKAITGIDYGEPFRDRYTSRRGAAKVIAKLGGDLRGLINDIMGEEKNTRLASRGDMVLGNQGNGDMLGVCNGESAVFIAVDGLVHIKMKDCECAWSID